MVRERSQCHMAETCRTALYQPAMSPKNTMLPIKANIANPTAMITAATMYMYQRRGSFGPGSRHPDSSRWVVTRAS